MSPSLSPLLSPHQTLVHLDPWSELFGRHGSVWWRSPLGSSGAIRFCPELSDNALWSWWRSPLGPVEIAASAKTSYSVSVGRSGVFVHSQPINFFFLDATFGRFLYKYERFYTMDFTKHVCLYPCQLASVRSFHFGYVDHV